MDQEVKKRGHKTKNDSTFSLVSKLALGESYILTKEEWAMKTLPGMHLFRRRTGKEFRVQTLKDNSGWKITALSV